MLQPKLESQQALVTEQGLAKLGLAASRLLPGTGIRSTALASLASRTAVLNSGSE